MRASPSLVGAVPLQGRLDGLAVAQHVHDFRVLPQPHGPQQHRDGRLAGAVHPDVDDIVAVGLKLQPCAAVRNDAGGVDDVAAGVDPCPKYTPGERTSWLTTTRSAPLMMKVPFSVMRGKSPMKTSCSLTSPVSLLISRTFTRRGRRR